MAVTETKLLASGFSGGLKGDSPAAASRSYQQHWYVKTAIDDSQLTITDYFRKTAGHPYLGDFYQHGNDKDKGSFCNKIDPQRDEKGGGTWVVVVNFDPPGEEQEGQDEKGNGTKDPLQFHDEISVSYTKISIPCEIAIFRGAIINGQGGQAIPPLLNIGEQIMPCNSAYVPFDPGLEQDVPIKIVTITKNVATFDGVNEDRFIDTVNSDLVTINKRPYGFRDVWKPLTALIQNVNASFNLTNKIAYWKHGREVHINPLTWRKFICDRGMQQRLNPGARRYNGQAVSHSDPDVNQLEALRDMSGFPLGGPVLFNGRGQPLDPMRESPVYLEYQVKDEIPFAGINW